MNDIEQWLQHHGLEAQVGLFKEQEIRMSDLPLLTDEDVRELGLPLGPRKRLLAAVEKLRQSEISTDDDHTAVQKSGRTGAERRQLTVVFCDLVGSTELSRKLDPEDMREINRAYQDACKNVIERYEGYIARYMGDGILAYFGYPRAHEDDPVRAIHAGLGVVSEMPALNKSIGRGLDAELSVRVGIATGRVVVGDVIGEGASQESTAIGETPNFAARLQGLAEPNSVVVATETRRLAISYFKYQEVAAQKVKGFTEPVTAWRVLGERDVGGRFESNPLPG